MSANMHTDSRATTMIIDAMRARNRCNLAIRRLRAGQMHEAATAIAALDEMAKQLVDVVEYLERGRAAARSATGRALEGRR